MFGFELFPLRAPRERRAATFWARVMSIDALVSFAVGVALGAGLSGCTDLASGSDTFVAEPARLAPVDAGTPPSDERWSCLDQPERARAVSVRSSVSLTLAIVDIGSGVSPEGLVARACSRLDVQCEAPLARALPATGDGQLQLPLAQGFAGFIEITSDSSVPTLFFLNEPLDGNAYERISVASPSGLTALAASAGLRLDPERGHLLIRAFDCDGAPAAGIALSNDTGGSVFSFRGGLPNVNGDVTTDEGLGGYVNVPPGLAFLQGREVSTQRISGETSVVVRAGSVTYGDLEPLRE